ncbi:MAG TPA: hypothetical protein VF037_05425, partial [Gemmatimonadales bacterium]
IWFKVYWAGWALLLGEGATLVLARGREGRVASRFGRARITAGGRRVALAAVALIVAAGGVVFYNTNVINEYQDADAAARDAAEYERRYGRFEGVPQPLLVATSLHAEIRPDERRAELRGRHRLVNRTGAAIDSIHVATSTELRTARLAFDRPASARVEDEHLGHAIYVLDQPLAPGDSLTLDFAVEYAPRGFRNDGVEAYVVGNGTMFGNQGWLPSIGYQPARELRDPADRLAHGLTARPSLPGRLEEVAARNYMGGSELIDFEAVVGTNGDQVAVAPGTLRRSWIESGRRYFHYASEAPIRNEYLLFSARYAVHEARWTDPRDPDAPPVSIQVYHHPSHVANLDRMVRSIRTSLTHYSAAFGPYPYRHLRFVERPGGDGGMSADASSVAFDEGFDRMHPDPSRGLDLPFYVVAHEVAHQWWGSQLASAPVEGMWLMSESLAVYSGMQVLRAGYDDDQVRRYLALVREIYAFPRSRAAVPLLRADGSFLGYRKGPLALHALARYVGEGRVNGALRRLIEKHAGTGPPLPTALDLYAELAAVTPDSLRYLLHDLFEANTYWDLETDAVRADSTADGWVVAIDVRAAKHVVDTAGTATEIPMDDWIEIGVYAPVPPGVQVLAEPLHLARHRVRSGPQTITVTVPQEPARAGIDPGHLLIDLVPEDNVERIRRPGDPAMDLL